MSNLLKRIDTIHTSYGYLNQMILTVSLPLCHFKVVLIGSVSLLFMVNATLQRLLSADGSPVACDIQLKISM